MTFRLIPNDYANLTILSTNKKAMDCVLQSIIADFTPNRRNSHWIPWSINCSQTKAPKTSVLICLGEPKIEWTHFSDSVVEKVNVKTPKLTLPKASKTLSKNSNIPMNKKNAPNPVKPIPISTKIPSQTCTVINSNLHYTRGVTLKRVTSVGIIRAT